MGECLITRRGGELFKLPVLDANYPENVSLTVIKGNTESASFRVAISETGTPAEYTYQWFCNGVAIEGATNSSYVKADMTEAGVHEFYCEIKNKAGTVTSRVATLNVTMHDVPVLNSAFPADVTADVGSSAEFKVQIEMNGNPPEYTYQWYLNDVAVEGANSATYTMNNLANGISKVYCKVTNEAGVVTSRTANLSATTRDLYNAGNTHSEITGGFTEVGDHITSTASASTSMSSDSIYASVNESATGYAAAIGRSTAKAISLKNVRSITVEGNCLQAHTPVSGHTGSAYVGVRVVGSKSLANSNIVADKYTTNTGSFTLNLDVSSLSGDYYVIVYAFSYSNYRAEGRFAKITMNY